MVTAFVMTTGDAVTQDEARARLAAADWLGAELIAQGVATLAEHADDADFVVEVRGVYGAEEGPIVRSAKHAARLPDRYRIVVLRVRAHDSREDFACRDDRSGVRAEQEAAGRIRRWWTGLRRPGFSLNTTHNLGMAAAS